MESAGILRDFAALVGPEVEDEDIDLLAAGLQIARAEYPALPVHPFVTQVEEYAARVRARLPWDPEPRDIISAVNRVLFTEERFRGNREHYSDPRNSFLNDVLTRKLGIPITLSVIYMEVARRAGLPLFGVGMPGHFLLKHYDVNGDEVLLDPFDDGRIVSRSDCQKRLDEIYDGTVDLEPRYLEVVRKRQILTRMLNNLRVLYMNSRAMRNALAVVDMILVIHPRSADDVKQRGVLRYSLNQYMGAVQDFEEYTRMAPEASDVDEVREAAISLRRALAMRN
jgi:regulator of sirC expression with transglutaminase-like and TPR domain